MSAPIINVKATVCCLHHGPASPMQPSRRVMVDGQPIITVGSPYTIVGCSLSSTSSPYCATGSFVQGALRVSSDGLAVALAMPNSSTCIPTGTAMVVSACQTRALAE